MALPNVSTLVLEKVSKRFERGIGVDDVALDVDAGEVVGVWGRRRSGRSTLARVAAGIERPDAGSVRIEGLDLWRDREARQRVAVWHPLFPADHGRTMQRQVAIALRRGRRSPAQVRAEATAALERVGAGHVGSASPQELDRRETVRVALARALVMRPRVLVLDEPMSGLDVLDAERLIELIVQIARHDQIAVLMTAGEIGQLAGVDRHLAISRGIVRGSTQPAPADVVRIVGA